MGGATVLASGKRRRSPVVSVGRSARTGTDCVGEPGVALAVRRAARGQRRPPLQPVRGRRSWRRRWRRVGSPFGCSAPARRRFGGWSVRRRQAEGFDLAGRQPGRWWSRGCRCLPVDDGHRPSERRPRSEPIEHLARLDRPGRALLPPGRVPDTLRSPRAGSGHARTAPRTRPRPTDPRRSFPPRDSHTCSAGPAGWETVVDGVRGSGYLKPGPTAAPTASASPPSTRARPRPRHRRGIHQRSPTPRRRDIGMLSPPPGMFSPGLYPEARFVILGPSPQILPRRIRHGPHRRASPRILPRSAAGGTSRRSPTSGSPPPTTSTVIDIGFGRNHPSTEGTPTSRIVWPHAPDLRPGSGCRR